MQDVEYDTEEEEEKWRVVSERLMPLPDDFDFLSTGNILKLSTLGKIFSRGHIEIVFLFFPENTIWHYMQIVCMKCRILFSRKNKKIVTNLLSAELAQRAVKVKMNFRQQPATDSTEHMNQGKKVLVASVLAGSQTQATFLICW